MKRLMFSIILPVVLLAYVPELKSVSVSTGKDYVKITLSFTGSPSNLHDFVLKNPARIVIDAEGVKYALGSNIFPVNQGDVVRVRGSQFKIEPLVSRVVIDLKKLLKYEVVREKNDVIVKIYTTPSTVGLKKVIKPVSMSKQVSNNKKQVSNNKDVKYGMQKTTRVKKSSIEIGAGVFYSSLGRRDPFKPLVEVQKAQDTLLDITKAKLIGIIRDSVGYVALIEDKDGNGFILRRGDRIKRGRVVDIRSNMAVFAISDFGFTRRVVLTLEKEEVSR